MSRWLNAPIGCLAQLLSVDDTLPREFESRLVGSSTLAFRVAFGVLRHRQDAEDVSQEAFALAHRRFTQLRDRSQFRSWLVRMAWRLAINRRRADQRRATRQSIAIDPAAAASAGALIGAQQRAQQLWRAIDALPDKLRMAIILAGIEGHDVQSVAGLLGVPEGTVKSRLFLARKRLRELLQ